ncbi:hypothetical protein BJY01DRAFT_259734 [Aspergillus pseudoustus]|uniref:Thioredoxin-like protein n=1 Tax=Aspergillus pseudoustus TaxID=1810923 RepID=A0ABR4J4H7_9EURO
MSDSTLYLYTSLTAGSSHIITATSRLETILKANKIPFRAIDVATDEAARKLWGRRSKGKKLPGLVKYGTVVGDLEQIEEWNEYGELKMQINNVEDLDSHLPATSNPIASTAESATTTTTASATATRPEVPTPKPSTIKIQDPPEKETQKDDSITVALRQAGEQAAAKAKEAAAVVKSSAPKSTSADEPQNATATAATEKPKEGGGEQSVRRMSVAPEIAESRSRPPLVPECAAESSSNFRADNVEALGLINHHRNSNIAAKSKEEAERIAKELRKSISGGDRNNVEHKDQLQSLRDDMARLGTKDTVDEALEA